MVDRRKKHPADSASSSASTEVILETRTVKMNAYQQGMQKSMTAANNVPHLYLHEKVDVSELDSMRQNLKK